MKRLLLITSFVCGFLLKAFSQEGLQEYFAQGLISLESQQEILDLENSIRQNTAIKVARLDPHSKRFFIISNPVVEFSQADLSTLFGSFYGSASCIQIGRYGVDAMNKFPFDCQNEE